MLLRSLTLQNFRNYRKETVGFHKRFNLITGENGQGKTNLLEAIYMLATTRPFSQLRLNEVIAFGEAQSRIKGEFETETGLNEVYISLTHDAKTVRLNGKVVYDVSKIAKRLSVVTFLPQDTIIVTGAPSERRRYLDANISRFEPAHVADLRQYQRAISQRNAIMQRSPSALDSIGVWDEKISEVGARIIKRRLKLLESLEPLLESIYHQVSQKETKITFDYKPSVSIEGDIEANLRQALADKLEHDKRMGHTTVGPHRDQPELALNSKSAATFASQGEVKTAAIALRSAEIELTKRILGRTPIVLLDDISSELDGRRKGYLYGLINKVSGQIFVTATSLKEALFSGEKRVFLIEAGRARILSMDNAD